MIFDMADTLSKQRLLLYALELDCVHTWVYIPEKLEPSYSRASINISVEAIILDIPISRWKEF